MHPSLLLVLLLKAAAVFAWTLGAPLWAGCVVFFGCDLWVNYQLFHPCASSLVRTCRRFRTARPEVWLTIDDGPDEHDTPRILDLLDRHGARATFFVIGEHAARHPALIAEIRRRGHEIGHHTHTHPAWSFWSAGPARVRRELDRALETLAVAGVRPVRFRAPVGIKNIFLHRALADRGMRNIAWSARGCDAISKNADKVVARVLRDARPGAILLMHEGSHLHENIRVHALARLLAALDERGLKCVIPADDQLDG